MLNQISFEKKNKYLPLLAIAGLLLCWVLAFSKTFEAIRLNYDLSRQASAGDGIAFNPVYTQRKLKALEDILSAYQVKEDVWSNTLWMKASAAAAKQGATIDYTVSRPQERDTTMAGLAQTLHCYGSFQQLVKVIDTLERTPGIGKLSALQFKGPKAAGSFSSVSAGTGPRSAACMVRLDFRAIENKEIQ
jgi:hypothetical protein